MEVSLSSRAPDCNPSFDFYPENSLMRLYWAILETRIDFPSAIRH